MFMYGKCCWTCSHGSFYRAVHVAVELSIAIVSRPSTCHERLLVVYLFIASAFERMCREFIPCVDMCVYQFLLSQVMLKYMCVVCACTVSVGIVTAGSFAACFVLAGHSRLPFSIVSCLLWKSEVWKYAMLLYNFDDHERRFISVDLRDPVVQYFAFECRP